MNYPSNGTRRGGGGGGGGGVEDCAKLIIKGAKTQIGDGETGVQGLHEAHGTLHIGHEEVPGTRLDSPLLTSENRMNKEVVDILMVWVSPPRTSTSHIKGRISSRLERNLRTVLNKFGCFLTVVSQAPACVCVPVQS